MNKVNYQKKLEEITGGLERRPSLLLHSCCGPCSSYCLSYLEKYFDITVLYYNPNIYPKEEYDLRLKEQRRFIDEAMNGVKLIAAPYDHSEFTEYVKGLENEKEGGARCEKCFELRLLKTAELAAEKGFDFFGTTLTVSPHKNAQVINSLGEKIAQEFTIAPAWLYADFKKKNGYKISIELSQKYGLYRQNFCGCEYSKQL